MQNNEFTNLRGEVIWSFYQLFKCARVSQLGFGSACPALSPERQVRHRIPGRPSTLKNHPRCTRLLDQLVPSGSCSASTTGHHDKNGWSPEILHCHP
jgi:hypothetical protein